MHHEPMDGPWPSPPGRRTTAVATCAAIVVALIGSVVACAYEQAPPASFAGALTAGAAIAALAVVGGIITLTVPGNRVGWLMLAAATVTGVGVGATEAGVHGIIAAPGSVPGATYLAAVGPGLRAAGMLLAVLTVPTVFPDGHLPGLRWRWLAWSAAGAVTCLFLGNVLSPNAQLVALAHWHSPIGLPLRYGSIADALSTVGAVLAVAVVAGAIAGLVTRWRRGGPQVRQQLLLLAVASGPPAALLLAVIVTNGVPQWLFGVVILPLPAAIVGAVLGHGLYDLRRAAHRTVLWLIMSGTVVAVYAIVTGSAAALAPGRLAWWPSALAAGAAALVLIPLRDVLQHAVTRVVYGRWSEPYEVLADLGERLEGAADIDRLLDAVVAELTTGLDLRGVSVTASDGTVVAGVPSHAGTAVPLLAYGAPVGKLIYLAPAGPLSEAEQRLLRDLARHLGGALHAWQLREDLRRARERLVLAREEERRRLRRDLHDGIGPALAGLTLKAETTRSLLPPGSDAASAQLLGLAAEIRQTVLDVRRLVEGLRPPALDELGLADACIQAVERLTTAADIATTVIVPPDLRALPAAVEVAAYRIVVEAVTNAVRHARARTCCVSLSCSPDGLSIIVTDDGIGLTAAGLTTADGHGSGNGMAIMRERAVELGGTILITAGPPGVRVEARLPAAARDERPAEAVPT